LQFTAGGKFNGNRLQVPPLKPQLES